MKKMITLNEAAKELNVFYGDLLILIKKAHLQDMENAFPEDLIPYGYIEELKVNYATDLPLQENLVEVIGEFNPALWAYKKNIEHKYKIWAAKWVQDNLSLYTDLLHSYRHKIGKLGLVEPTSYKDFCAALIVSCGGDMIALNNIFSRKIEFKLFEIYDEFKMSGKYYDLLDDLLDYNCIHYITGGTAIAVKFVPQKEHIGHNLLIKAKKQPKRTKQWAFYYALLEINGLFSLGMGVNIKDYFDDLGIENDFDGHHIYQEYSRMKTLSGLRIELKKSTAPQFIDLAIELLKENDYLEVAAFAKSEYEKANTQGLSDR